LIAKKKKLVNGEEVNSKHTEWEDSGIKVENNDGEKED
jgi:hypothetical protein